MHRKSKKANPHKRICPYWKTISHNFFENDSAVKKLMEFCIIESREALPVCWTGWL
jgi:hypothetical protein